MWREKENKMPFSSQGRDKKTKGKKTKQNKRTHTHSETQMGGKEDGEERGRGNKVRKDKNLQRHRVLGEERLVPHIRREWADGDGSRGRRGW